MPLPNPGMTFTPFDILTAAELNDIVENIESLADGTGFDAGAIGTTDIADDAVTYIKLLSTIFSGQLLSQANAGSMGGTMYYINLGGIKLLWVIGTSGAVNTNTTRAVTFPVSFFTTIQHLVSGVAAANNVVYTMVTSHSASSASVQLQSTTNMNATPTLLVIGS